MRHGTEIVHLASPVALGAWGTRVARAERLPVVAVFQTDLPSYARAYHLGRVAESFTWHWLRDVHNTAGRTLAPSNMTAADLADHGIERVRRWGRGVDTERFQPSRRDEVLRAALAPNGEVIVGYVGRLAIEKRVDLLAAVAALPGVKLAVTGGGPMEEGLRAALPEAAFLGVRSGTDLARIYASLDVFVHTGPFETFGQTIREPPPAACRSSRPPRAAPLTSLTTEGPATWSRPATRTCSRRPCSSWPRTRRCAPGSARRRGGAAAGPRPDLVRAHRRAARTLRGRHRGGRAARPAGGVRQPIVGVWAGMA